MKLLLIKGAYIFNMPYTVGLLSGGVRKKFPEIGRGTKIFSKNWEGYEMVLSN